MKLIIVAGLPATGKTTLAKKLSAALGMPILEKDEIKEEMFDTLGYADLAGKRALNKAAGAILLRCAESILQKGYPLIMVNNFDREESKALGQMLDRVGCDCMTVFLGGDPDVLWARYVERDKRRARHQGHSFIDRYPPKEGDNVNVTMPRAYFAEHFEQSGMSELRVAGSRLDLDATDPDTIDVDALIVTLNEWMQKGEPV